MHLYFGIYRNVVFVRKKLSFGRCTCLILMNGCMSIKYVQFTWNILLIERRYKYMYKATFLRKRHLFLLFLFSIFYILLNFHFLLYNQCKEIAKKNCTIIITFFYLFYSVNLYTIRYALASTILLWYSWFVRDVIAVHVIIVQLVMSPEY